MVVVATGMDGGIVWCDSIQQRGEKKVILFYSTRFEERHLDVVYCSEYCSRVNMNSKKVVLKIFYNF